MQAYIVEVKVDDHDDMDVMAELGPYSDYDEASRVADENATDDHTYAIYAVTYIETDRELVASTHKE